MHAPKAAQPKPRTERLAHFGELLSLAVSGAINKHTRHTHSHTSLPLCAAWNDLPFLPFANKFVFTRVVVIRESSHLTSALTTTRESVLPWSSLLTCFKPVVIFGDHCRQIVQYSPGSENMAFRTVDSKTFLFDGKTLISSFKKIKQLFFNTFLFQTVQIFNI